MNVLPESFLGKKSHWKKMQFSTIDILGLQSYENRNLESEICGGTAGKDT